MEGTREGKCINKHGCGVWGEYFRAQVKQNLHASTLQDVHHRMFGNSKTKLEITQVSTNREQILPGILGVKMHQLQICVSTQTNLRNRMLRGKQPSHK